MAKWSDRSGIDSRDYNLIRETTVMSVNREIWENSLVQKKEKQKWAGGRGEGRTIMKSVAKEGTIMTLMAGGNRHCAGSHHYQMINDPQKQLSTVVKERSQLPPTCFFHYQGLGLIPCWEF